MLANVAAALQFGLRTFPVSIIVEEQLRLRTHALASPAGRSEAHVQVHFHRRRGAVAESQAIREHAGKVDASSEPGSEDGYLAGLLEEARSALPIPHRALMATAEIAFTLPGSEDLEACDQEDVAGSLGHPYFCRRPCVLLAVGRCRNGMACKYCHHAHGSEKPQAFPRNIRERINRMKGSAKLRLLRDSLHQKLQQVPELASQVTGLVDIIEEGLRNEAPESSETTGSRLPEKVAVKTVAAMLGDLVVEFANVVACFLFGIRSIQAESLLCWHERSPMSPETANAELKVTCSPGTSSRTFSVAYRKSSDVSASKPERSRSRGMELRTYNSDTGLTCAMVVCVCVLLARKVQQEGSTRLMRFYNSLLHFKPYRSRGFGVCGEGLTRT